MLNYVTAYLSNLSLALQWLRMTWSRSANSTPPSPPGHALTGPTPARVEPLTPPPGPASTGSARARAAHFRPAGDSRGARSGWRHGRTGRVGRQGRGRFTAEWSRAVAPGAVWTCGWGGGEPGEAGEEMGQGVGGLRWGVCGVRGHGEDEALEELEWLPRPRWGRRAAGSFILGRLASRLHPRSAVPLGAPSWRDS